MNMAMKSASDLAGRTISIIGTGDFGRAMAIRLVRAEYSVVMGSRHPQGRMLSARHSILDQVRVTSIGEAIKSSNVIFVALHPAAYSSLEPYSHLFDQKIVIDVSNPKKKPKEGSQSEAERLASMVPRARVVKAFNTVSAYALEFEHAGETRNVYICSDDVEARDVVHRLASEICFHSIDCGGLRNSERMERSSLSLLSGWGWPSIVTGIVFIIWFVYCILRYYVLRSNPYTWDRIPTNVFNKAFGTSSITLLALAYMPGCFAAFIQLANGTKHKPFSRSLDRWLKMRKQLGLYALLFAVLHMCMSMTLLTPAYYSKMFHTYRSTVPLNRTADTVLAHTSRMNWNGETLVFLGFLAVASMSLLGIASLPSVASSLNWREWKFVQSHMGFVCLLLCEAHVTVKALPDWTTLEFKAIAQGLTFTSSILPYFTLAMKLILLIPCVYYYLDKIRSGWERNVSYAPDGDVEAGSAHRRVAPALRVDNGHANQGFQQTGL